MSLLAFAVVCTSVTTKPNRKTNSSRYNNRLRHEILRSIVFVGWLVRSFVNIRRAPLALADGQPGYQHRSTWRLAEIAPYQRYYLLLLLLLLLLLYHFISIIIVADAIGYI